MRLGGEIQIIQQAATGSDHFGSNVVGLVCESLEKPVDQLPGFFPVTLEEFIVQLIYY